MVLCPFLSGVAWLAVLLVALILQEETYARSFAKKDARTTIAKILESRGFDLARLIDLINDDERDAGEARKLSYISDSFTVKNQKDAGKRYGAGDQYGQIWSDFQGLGTQSGPSYERHAAGKRYGAGDQYGQIWSDFQGLGTQSGPSYERHAAEARRQQDR